MSKQKGDFNIYNCELTQYHFKMTFGLHEQGKLVCDVLKVHDIHTVAAKISYIFF